jgi:hypothetical protein
MTEITRLGLEVKPFGHGAKGRLVGLRPGVWTVTPFNDWRYSIFPDGVVGWIPKEIDLPQTLFVPFRNDVH